jgi:hypothetical protein
MNELRFLLLVAKNLLRRDMTSQMAQTLGRDVQSNDTPQSWRSVAHGPHHR